MVPGPGKYEHEHTRTFKSVNWKCESQRDILKKPISNNLGPGEYNTKAHFGEGGPKV
jgi:hypothetical protein